MEECVEAWRQEYVEAVVLVRGVTEVTQVTRDTAGTEETGVTLEKGRGKERRILHRRAEGIAGEERERA
jgi:hypothetical protein